MEKDRYYKLEDPVPFGPIHPGEFLSDELMARSMSQRKFAALIGCSCSFLNEIIKGKRSISTETAFRIEAATGIKAHIWINLQSAYDMQMARNNKQFSAVLQKIRQASAMQ